MHNFKKLTIWQKARALSIETYKATKSFPETEIFGLTNQMRRAAISIISNIAEGCGRITDKQFKQFLTYASGSASELEAQLIIAQDLKLLPEDVFKILLFKLNEIQKMLRALINKY